MAGPPTNERDGTMLEIATTSHIPTMPIEPTTSSNNIMMNGYASLAISTTTRPQHDFHGSRPTRESVLQRLSEALMRRSLTKIDLSQRGLQPSDARLVKMALSQNSSLTVLKLGYNNLGDDGVATLATGIAIHHSLVLLDLGFNNFGDDGAKALAMSMRQAAGQNKGGSLRTLYLAGNLIGEDGAVAIADFIRRGSHLRQLYMTGNRIGGDGVKAITDAILEDELGMDEESKQQNHSFGRNPAIDEENVRVNSSFHGMQELFFGGTGMGTNGCQAISRLLEKTCCLRVLSLPNCDIGDEEVAMLASSIKTNRERLPVESIQLSFNNVTHRGLESLTNSVWGSATLRELKLDNNEIGDRGAHQIAAILPVLKSLEVLDVGFNGIKVTGLNVLMKTVAEVNHLRSLSVSGNSIDVPAAKAVAYALAYNRSLQSIFLVHCSVNHEGQRHIAAGIVSNPRTSVRKLTGFDIGPVVVTLGFPAAQKHWTNEQVLNFVHMMWNKSKDEELDTESELDPLNFLRIPADEKPPTRYEPLEASVVVEVANKAYESLVANGVDVFSKRIEINTDPSFGSPIASNSIMTESSSEAIQYLPLNHLMNGEAKLEYAVESSSTSPINFAQQTMPTKLARSFVAPPEPNASSRKQEMPDPARKKRVVEWLCSNIQHLNELSQQPFSSRELWKLHQHYFTPVVNESGGSAPQNVPRNRIVSSSVPEVSRGSPEGSEVTPSTESIDDHLSVPVSDPVFPGSPAAPVSLPILKRKVSYRFLGDATSIAQPPKVEARLDSNLHSVSVARMIEDGHTGHSLPPKTKRARRNRARISFLPRIKAKLDSYLDVCHEKALITMRQLYYVEQAILSGKVNPLDHSAAPMSHLTGVLASEAEMIIVDMI